MLDLIKSNKKQLKEISEQVKPVLMQLVRDLGIHSFAWIQYYCEDGFLVDDDIAVRLDENDVLQIRHDLDEDWYQNANKTKVFKCDRPNEKKENINKVMDVFCEIPNNILEDLFGEEALVIVYSDKIETGDFKYPHRCTWTGYYNKEIV